MCKHGWESKSIIILKFAVKTAYLWLLNQFLNVELCLNYWFKYITMTHFAHSVFAAKLTSA